MIFHLYTKDLNCLFTIITIFKHFEFACLFFPVSFLPSELFLLISIFLSVLTIPLSLVAITALSVHWSWTGFISPSSVNNRFAGYSTHAWKFFFQHYEGLTSLPSFWPIRFLLKRMRLGEFGPLHVLCHSFPCSFKNSLFMSYLVEFEYNMSWGGHG